MKTRQEIFDIVVSGLRKQGCKSIGTVINPDVNPACLYRDAQGHKCAAGFLIPDEKYKPEMENTAIFDDLIRNVLIEENIDIRDFDFLYGLQAIHDFHPVERWEEQWKLFAQKYDIVYTPPSN